MIKKPDVRPSSPDASLLGAKSASQPSQRSNQTTTGEINSPSDSSFVKSGASSVAQVKQSLLPAMIFNRKVEGGKELLDLSKIEHDKGLPMVFVVYKDGHQNPERVVTKIGVDVFNESGKASDETIHSSLKTAQNIIMLLQGGRTKEIDIRSLEMRDPYGFLTESLLRMNANRRENKDDDAENRVAVSAALCLGTFGFIDTDLADKMLSPIDTDLYYVGVQRTFQMSVSLSYHELAECMIQWGANPNKPREDDGMLPIHSAKRHTDEKMIQILLESGAKKDSAQ